MSPTEKALQKLSKAKGLTLLEYLQAARDSILDPEKEWYFGSWSTCTCGHLYQGSYGKQGGSSLVTTPRGRYRRLLDAVADTNNLYESTGWEKDRPYYAVSDGTTKMAQKLARKGGDYEPGQKLLKRAAVKLIDNTIEHIENEQREAMLRVAS